MSGQAYEQLTLFPADSHASPSPWLESKRAKGTIVTSGLRCCELSENCARVALSVRTFLESSRLPPGRWSRIWSVLAITSSCLILRLRLSELGTGDRECFSLRPTPNTMDALPPKSPEALKKEMTVSRPGRKQPCNLRDWVAVQEGRSLWPTPTARDCKGANSMEHLTQPKMPGNSHHVCQLANAVKLFTTPCAGDAQGSHGGNNHRSLRTDVAGQLNPTWVEWLMGFPPGWTDLNVSETR
nr:MAG TPA: hypothetical protein [Caudoviricetes sp.]